MPVVSCLYDFAVKILLLIFKSFNDLLILFCKYFFSERKRQNLKFETNISFKFENEQQILSLNFCIWSRLKSTFWSNISSRIIIYLEKLEFVNKCILSLIIIYLKKKPLLRF